MARTGHYAADPLGPYSEAVVEWSMPEGGLPEHAARRLLFYLVGVREALELLGADYERLSSEDGIEQLCVLLLQRVAAANEARRGRLRGSWSGTASL